MMDTVGNNQASVRGSPSIFRLAGMPIGKIRNLSYEAVPIHIPVIRAYKHPLLP